MMGDNPLQHIEVRCLKCGKMLGKNDGDGSFEVKCSRCGTLNAMLEHESQQIIITDPDGVVLYTNEALEKITGYTASEVIGHKPSVWGGQMPPEFYAELWNTIKIKKQSTKVVVRNKRKNGTMYSAILQISPILDSNKEILFFVGVENPIKTIN